MAETELDPDKAATEQFRRTYFLNAIMRKIIDTDSPSIGYNESFFLRRLNIRMQAVGAENYLQYLKKLKDPIEVVKLRQTLSINVTEFFRDSSVFDLIRCQILPQLPMNRTIRIWSAGCATGEEPYSIAILLLEALRPRLNGNQFKITATDVSPQALDAAKKGVYQEKFLKNLDSKMLRKYFTKEDEGYMVNEEIRSHISFIRHDLQKSAPPFYSAVDMIFCRNVMIYFAKPMQKRILEMFHSALSDSTGFLVLGKVESTQGDDLFTPIDIRERVYRKSKPTTKP